MNCEICAGNHVVSRKTIISPFLVKRIWDSDKIIPVTLYHCKDCGFTWFSYHLTPDEEGRLYGGYRSDEYQTMREKLEPLYTKELNYALGHDDLNIKESQKLIKNILFNHISSELKYGLDYGGDIGQKYPVDYPILNKYVYDISGVKPLDGIHNITCYDDCKDIEWDFIMCNHCLEHQGNLHEFVDMVKSLGNNSTWFYFEVPFDSPFVNHNKKINLHSFWSLIKIKGYLTISFADKIMPTVCAMHEHVNYFTPKSMKTLFEKHGFAVHYCELNTIQNHFGNSNVISLLCKLI